MRKTVAHNGQAADVMVSIVVAAQMEDAVAANLLTRENVAGEYVTAAAWMECSSVVYM